MQLRVGGLALLAVMAASSPTIAGETIRVAIDKMTFDPPKVSASSSATRLEWASSDFVVHTATARNKDWDVTVPAKGMGRVALEHPGEVDYFCRFHPNMTGRISVTP